MRIECQRRSDRAGNENAVMPARMELIGDKIILDGGHNEGCASALKAFLERFASGRRIAVCALMGDKDCDTYLRLTAPLFEKNVSDSSGQSAQHESRSPE